MQKYSIYKYVKTDKGWRYRRPAFASNNIIRPNVVIADGIGSILGHCLALNPPRVHYLLTDKLLLSGGLYGWRWLYGPLDYKEGNVYWNLPCRLDFVGEQPFYPVGDWPWHPILDLRGLSRPDLLENVLMGIPFPTDTLLGHYLQTRPLVFENVEVYN